MTKIKIILNGEEKNIVSQTSIADLIEQLGIEKVRIRSVLTCEAEKGVCIKCYGRNLAT